MKIAVVASSWHFPLHFYASMKAQTVPEGCEIDFFAVSHRDPKFAVEEKKDKVFPDNMRGDIDRIFYDKIATVEQIEALGWKYKEYPNTVGDWGNSNQWLADNFYKDYDLFLFTHDDNYLIGTELFVEALKYERWDILANSIGMPKGSVRGSFEFFTREVIDLMGGRFDLSGVKLDKQGETSVSEELTELYDWNSMAYDFMDFAKKNNLRLAFFSPFYRMSPFCLEGERGYISNTHGGNTEYEEEGLRQLKNMKLI